LDVSAVLAADVAPRGKSMLSARQISCGGGVRRTAAAPRCVLFHWQKFARLLCFGNSDEDILLSCLRGGTDGDLERHTAEPARHAKS
jgi:hypothetical protein